MYRSPRGYRHLSSCDRWGVAREENTEMLKEVCRQIQWLKNSTGVETVLVYTGNIDIDNLLEPYWNTVSQVKSYDQARVAV